MRDVETKRERAIYDKSDGRNKILINLINNSQYYFISHQQ